MIGHRSGIEVSQGVLFGEGPPSIMIFSASSPLVIPMPEIPYREAKTAWLQWRGFTLSESGYRSILASFVQWARNIAGKVRTWVKRRQG